MQLSEQRPSFLKKIKNKHLIFEVIAFAGYFSLVLPLGKVDTRLKLLMIRNHRLFQSVVRKQLNATKIRKPILTSMPLDNNWKCVWIDRN